MSTKSVLGLDIGNVILTQVGGTSEDGTPIEGALDSIQQIVAVGTFSEIYLVSKCGMSVRKKTRLWLKNLDFWEYTGIPENHLKFCRTNFGKSPICWRLGITDFVDDRTRVLDNLWTVRNKYLFGSNVEVDSNQYILVDNWSHLKDVILRSE